MNDTASADEDESITLNVMANDTDADSGDTRTLVRVDQSSANGASIFFDPTTGEVQYTADSDVFDLLSLGGTKTDSFSCTMKDSAGVESNATVTVTVKGVADGLTINGTVHPDTLTGTTKDESIYGDNSDDVIYGETGADRLMGGNGMDRLFGGDGIDQLFGDNGSDTLNGGRGNDVLTGGLGPDTFVFGKHVVNGTTYNSGADVITDFKVQNDQIRLDDGLTIKSMANHHANGDGVMDIRITLSNNATIDLLGVSNLSDPGQLLVG